MKEQEIQDKYYVEIDPDARKDYYKQARERKLAPIVEAYEDKILKLSSEFRLKRISRLAYEEARTVARAEFMTEFIHVYTNASPGSARFYENVVYTALQQQVTIDSGATAAKERIETDMRNANNVHGEHVISLDSDDLDRMLNLANKINLTKAMFYAMGLPEEAELVISEIVRMEFQPRKVGSNVPPVVAAAFDPQGIRKLDKAIDKVAKKLDKLQ